VYGWTVQIDRTMEEGVVSAIGELAKCYGVPVAYSVSVPEGVLTLQINGTGAHCDATSLHQLATFAVLLTAILDGGSLDDIGHRLAADAKAVLPRLGSASAA
jgi:hypothetical protein